MTLPNLECVRPQPVTDLVRVGRPVDGGYVLPERAVLACTHLIGMGISDDWSFEEDLLERNPSAQLVAVDGSVSVKRFGRAALNKLVFACSRLLKGEIKRARRALLEAKWSVATALKFGRFFAGADRLFVEKMVRADRSADGITWAEVLALLRPETNRPKSIVLKVDIEGGEYDLLPDLLRESQDVSLLVIEFHDCGTRWREFEFAIEQLKVLFAVVHVHGNNYIPLIPGTDVPDVLEITLLKRDLFTEADVFSSHTTEYPIRGLDFPNDASKVDYPLTF